MTVAFDGVGGGTTGASAATTLTFAHTVTAGGLGSVLLVFTGANGDINPTGVTYNLVALKGPIATITAVSTGDRTIAVWSLLSPPAGTANVVVTGASNNYSASSLSFTNADPASPLGIPATFGGAALSGTTNLSSTNAASLIATGVCVRSTTNPTSSGSPTPTVKDAGELSTTNVIEAAAIQTAGGAVSETWTIGTSDAIAIISVEVRPPSRLSPQPFLPLMAPQGM